MRRAFGLAQALLVILFVGGIVTVTMRYASLGAKHYADSYTREQAELFMQSATEAALLRIGAYDRTANDECIPVIRIDSEDGRFHADVDILSYYLFEGKDNDGSVWNCDRIVPIQTPESHGMVDLRVVVTSEGGRTGNPVRLEQRSLQRP